MCLAPVAAAALAVAECFAELRGRPEAGRRTVTLDLWKPDLLVDAETLPGLSAPPLSYAPAGWALVGLGHLGQANAWCIPPAAVHRPDAGGRRLHYDDYVDTSNQSTGVLVRPRDVDHRKTRMVAAALDELGIRASIIERRLDDRDSWRPGDPDVGLIGVDAPGPRRGLSKLGWPLIVDAGLGTGALGYTEVAIHSFPGPIESQDLPAWQASARPVTDLTKTARAYQSAVDGGADPCGIVTLAGRAAAAAFVGVLAATLAVSEPLRRLHGQSGTAVLTLNVARLGSARSSLTPGNTPPIPSLPLGPHAGIPATCA